MYPQQYYAAYPQIPNAPPPSAANGYGWSGHGLGWQLDPNAWQTPKLYPDLNDVVEEPPCASQVVKKQEVNAQCIVLNCK